MKTLSRFFVCVVLAAIFSLAASVVASGAQAAQLGGVNVHSLWDSETDAQMTHELNVAASAHVSVLRVDVGWSAFEGDGPGQHPADRVAKLDALMAGAASRGIKVLPVVFSTPCWASSAPDSLKQGCAGAWWDRGVTAYPPTDPSTYGKFLQWLTGRYGAEMAGVEVWNEPNESGFLSAADPAGAYAQLLKAGYAGAKAGNLNVPVIAGAIAGANVTFLNQLYADGIQGHYDGLSIHTYSGAQSPMFDPGVVGRQATVVPGIKAVHAAQLAAGDHTPLWITEFGWQTQSGLYQAVSDQVQASYTTTAFAAIAKLSYVKAAIVYDLRDGPDATNYMDHYGLMNENFTPKPALAALRNALAAPATVATSGTGTAKHLKAVATRAKSAKTAKPRTVTPTGTNNHGQAALNGATVRRPARLGTLRAANIYNRATHAHRLAAWRVGGRVHVLPVRAQARAFTMVLTKTSRSTVALVFARCGGASTKACSLYSTRINAAGRAGRVSRVAAGSRFARFVSTLTRR
jgi:hypothetical protein